MTDQDTTVVIIPERIVAGRGFAPIRGASRETIGLREFQKRMLLPSEYVRSALRDGTHVILAGGRSYLFRALPGTNASEASSFFARYDSVDFSKAVVYGIVSVALKNQVLQTDAQPETDHD